MNFEQFNNAIGHIRDVSLDTLVRKNTAYSKGTGNPLHNFDAGAAIAGVTPAQTAWGYLTKHLVALRDRVERNDFTDLSDFEEKCQDVINYVAIIYAIGLNDTAQRCKFGQDRDSYAVSTSCEEAATQRMSTKEPMTLTLYQQLAKATANPKLHSFDQLRNAAYGLNGEAGEVIDLLKKHEFQGHDLDTERIVKELGDVLWYVALGCTAMDMDMTEVAQKNIDKLRGRYPNGFTPDKSINREDE